MLFPKLLLCTVAALAWGYGNDNSGGTGGNAANANYNYGNGGGSGNTGVNGNANAKYGAYPQPIYLAYDDYSSEEHHHHKKSCKSKLQHYDLTAKDPAHSILEAKWKPVEKDGKDFTLITCPADCKNCALVAEMEGNTATISTTKYSDTVILADGFKTGVLAKCHGKRTTFVLDNEEKIVIKNVACIKYPETPLPCTVCNMDILRGSGYKAIYSVDEQTVDQCKKLVVTCTKTSTCRKVQVKVGVLDTLLPSLTPTPASSGPATAEFFCQNDGTFLSPVNDFQQAITKVECIGSMSC